jgi:hypothetical protein
MPDNYRICGKCGGSLVPPESQKKLCQNCGFEMPAAAKFCGKCKTAFVVPAQPVMQQSTPSPHPQQSNYQQQQYTMPQQPQYTTLAVPQNQKNLFLIERIAVFVAAGFGILTLFMIWDSWYSSSTRMYFVYHGFEAVFGWIAFILFATILTMHIIAIIRNSKKIFSARFGVALGITCISSGAAAVINSLIAIGLYGGSYPGSIIALLAGIVACGASIFGFALRQKNPKTQ